MVPSTTDPFLRIAVVTVAHRGDDARIWFRQISALRRAGVAVSFVGPLPGIGDNCDGPAPLERIVIERAAGRRRMRPWLQAFSNIRKRRGVFDLVLVHDLEAVIPVRLARPGCPVVWDVHEDLVASVADREWIPGPCRPLMRTFVGAVERFVCGRSQLILAEESYRARFGDWPVVPNSTLVPAIPPPFKPPAKPLVVYVGRISWARGLAAMIRLGRELAGEATIELIGDVDDDARAELIRAVSDGSVKWAGPLPNPKALCRLRHASVGLCLLEPAANYVGSMPTKILEYFAYAVPVVVSPLPLAVDVLRSCEAGFVVDPEDPIAVSSAVRQLLVDPRKRTDVGMRGHEWVQRHHDWTVDGPRFVKTLRAFAGVAST